MSFDPKTRAAARLAAVQALYEMDVTDADVDQVLAEFMSKRWSTSLDEDGETVELRDFDKTFLIDVVRGVSDSRAKIDEMIAGALQDSWTPERLEMLLRAILRAGVFELVNFSDIPAKVIINEYMDVAQAFFTKTEPKLVNGVLDRLAKTLRESLDS